MDSESDGDRVSFIPLVDPHEQTEKREGSNDWGNYTVSHPIIRHILSNVLAGSAAIYCPSRSSRHTQLRKENITEYGERWDGKRCTPRVDSNLTCIWVTFPSWQLTRNQSKVADKEDRSEFPTSSALTANFSENQRKLLRSLPPATISYIPVATYLCTIGPV